MFEISRLLFLIVFPPLFLTILEDSPDHFGDVGKKEHSRHSVTKDDYKQAQDKRQDQKRP
jgi:hypothetical protein